MNFKIHPAIGIARVGDSRPVSIWRLNRPVNSRLNATRMVMRSSRMTRNNQLANSRTPNNESGDRRRAFEFMATRTVHRTVKR